MSREEVKRGVCPPLSCPTCLSWALGNQGARRGAAPPTGQQKARLGQGHLTETAAAPITHLRPILGVKGGVGFSRDLWRECQLSATLGCLARKMPVGGALPEPRPPGGEAGGR